jgi:hypothetical protein
MHARRRREDLINVGTFLCQNRPVSVARRTKRYRPLWEEALSGSGAGQCTVGGQRQALGLIHALY